MSGVFEHLAATDDTERVFARKAVAVANKRVQDFLGDFIKCASNDEERRARLALVEDDVSRIVVAVTDEYGGDPENTLSAIREVLGCDGAESSSDSDGDSDDDDGDDDFDADDAQSAFERNKFKKKDSKTAGPLGEQPHLPGAEPEPQSINVEPNWEGMRAWLLNMAKTDPEKAQEIAAAMGSEAPPELVDQQWPLGGGDAASRVGPPERLLGEDPGEIQNRATSKTARRPKMCPYHSELVDASLQAGEPQYAAYSALVGGPSHCKGGFGGSCNFKSDMVTQSYWDGKQQQAEERARQRELERAQSPQVAPAPQELPPLDPGEGITDINTELSEAPSAVGEAPSEHFPEEPAMAMAASRREALGFGDIADAAAGAAGPIAQGIGEIAPAAAPAALGAGMGIAQGVHPLLQGLNQHLHQQQPVGGGPYQGAKPGIGGGAPQEVPGESMGSLFSSERTADADRDGGGAVKRESLPNRTDDHTTPPSPKTDHKTWKPNALNADGNLAPVDSEQSGSPHATETQDVTDDPNWGPQNEETWPPSDTNSVTEVQDLPTADESGATTERNTEQPHTDTFNNDGQADPVTSEVGNAVLSAAQDPDKNPLRSVLESGFPTEDEVQTAIARFQASSK